MSPGGHYKRSVVEPGPWLRRSPHSHGSVPGTGDLLCHSQSKTVQQGQVRKRIDLLDHRYVSLGSANLGNFSESTNQLSTALYQIKSAKARLLCRPTFRCKVLIITDRD